MKLVEVKDGKVVNRIMIDAANADAFMSDNPQFIKAADTVQVGYSYDGAVFSAPEKKTKAALDQEMIDALRSRFVNHMADPLIFTLIKITVQNYAAIHKVAETAAFDHVRDEYVEASKTRLARKKESD